MTAAVPPSFRPFREARGLRVLGMGLALPGPAIPTGELIDRVERNFGVSIRVQAESIAGRLGIEARHCSRDLEQPVEATRPGCGNADLAARAVRAALSDAGLRVRDLGYLIGHTATPDTLLPPGVAGVADRLGYDGPFAEFRQACTGFANALVMAHGLLAGPDAAPVAIVGSETGSVYLDPRRVGADRAQLVNMLQMGDAAAAIVLCPADWPANGAGQGAGDVLDNLAFGCAGLHAPPGMALREGGSASPSSRGCVPQFDHDFAAIRRSGPDLFRAGADAARAFGTDLSAVRAVIPHQANGRLDEMVAEDLRVPPALICTHARRVGNTGSAAIWAALAELRPRMAPGEAAVALGAEATKHMFATFRLRRG